MIERKRIVEGEQKVAGVRRVGIVRKASQESKRNSNFFSFFLHFFFLFFFNAAVVRDVSPRPCFFGPKQVPQHHHQHHTVLSLVAIYLSTISLLQHSLRKKLVHSLCCLTKRLNHFVTTKELIIFLTNYRNIYCIKWKRSYF